MAGSALKFPKSSPLRSDSYRRYVASQECFGCGIEGHSQAAHPNHGKGLGMKTDDRRCFPLCGPRPGHMGCHYMLDNLIDMDRNERRELEEKYTAKMQERARADLRAELKDAA